MVPLRHGNSPSRDTVVPLALLVVCAVGVYAAIPQMADAADVFDGAAVIQVDIDENGNLIQGYSRFGAVNGDGSVVAFFVREFGASFPSLYLRDLRASTTEKVAGGVDININ